MWLIETSTFRLSEFTTSVPSYATLSHVTEEDEAPHESPGHIRREICNRSRKTVERACVQARTAGISWLWNYATCVDRYSWAAQSEAINSLAQIYRGCEYTIIYLADLVFELVGHETLGERLADCRWFKNIWSIPQIIFSRAAFFFSTDWTQIGTKISLLPLISAIIGIDKPALDDSDCLEDYSIAKRMSWASRMTTTRTEDSAYALLGLFDVSLPIIHGEGQKAFFKLQEEILKDTNDFSLFAWDSPVPQEYTGLLAPSPACFHRFKRGPIAPLRVDGEVHIHCAGITIQASLWKSRTGWLLPLQSDHGSFCSIPLIPWGGCFVRKGSQVDWNLPGPRSTETARICVKRNLSTRVSRNIGAYEGIISEKTFQSLRPLDDTSFQRGPVEPNSERGTCSTEPDVEAGCQTVSNKVRPHPNLSADSAVASGLSHQDERNRLDLVVPFQSLVNKENNEPMVLDLGGAQTRTISGMLPSDPVSMTRGSQHYNTESSPSTLALGESDRHERPSCAHETTLKVHQLPEDVSIGDSGKELLGSSCDRLVSKKVQVTPQSLTSINESLPAEV